jgi:hypothetical protein
MPTEKSSGQDHHAAANALGLSMKGHACPAHEDRHSSSSVKVLLATIAGVLLILAAGIRVGVFIL